MYGFDGKRLYVSHRFSCPNCNFLKTHSTWIIAVLGPVTGRIESRRLWSSLLKPSHQISTSTSVYDSMNTECIVLGQYHVCLARYNASSKIIEAFSSNHLSIPALAIWKSENLHLCELNLIRILCLIILPPETTASTAAAPKILYRYFLVCVHMVSKFANQFSHYKKEFLIE